MGRGQRDTSKPRPVPPFPPPVALGKCRALWRAERQRHGAPLFSCRVPQAEPGSYKALYNSQLRFRRRLYADLETVPYHVHLSRPLAQLMKHAVLYVRNTVPRQVFQALSRCGPARAPPSRTLCQGGFGSVRRTEGSLTRTTAVPAECVFKKGGLGRERGGRPLTLVGVGVTTQSSNCADMRLCASYPLPGREGALWSTPPTASLSRPLPGGVWVGAR